jgi:excinuclease ABC subunit B
MDFRLVAPFQPSGDQPEAIHQLIDGINKGYKHQVLLGATGTGETYTMAQVITQLQHPALVIAQDRAQLAMKVECSLLKNGKSKGA